MNAHARTRELYIAVVQAIKRNEQPKNIAVEFRINQNLVYKIKRRYFDQFKSSRFGGPISPPRETRLAGPIGFVGTEKDKTPPHLPSSMEKLAHFGPTTPLKII